jgi:hypothetical protein
LKPAAIHESPRNPPGLRAIRVIPFGDGFAQQAVSLPEKQEIED